MTTCYEINAADDITSVGGAWDSFAQENDGVDAMAAGVVGRRLWDFIGGVRTVIYLHAILSRCRNSGQAFETTYRCDSLQEARLYHMRVMPGENWLRVIHRPIWTAQMKQSRKVIALTDLKSANRCSICCAYRVGNKWFDVLLVPDLIHFPRGYELCDKCQDYTAAYLEPPSQATPRITR